MGALLVEALSVFLPPTITTMAGKPKNTGNAFSMPKPKKRVPKPKMSYNKRLLSKMRTRLKKLPGM